MSLLSNRLFLSPLQWTIIAGVMGLSACSSTSKDLGNNRQSDDTSLADLEGSDSSGTQHSSNNHLPGMRQSGRAYRKSVRPVVKSVPTINNGQWLNAFYFVTSDTENWESLSQKFYNRPDRADRLSLWNDGLPVRVGSVVYYNSPFRPTDRDRMLSFAQDFGQAPLRHQVQAGDTLSKLALSLWGNVHAWPAIAAANPQLVHPDVIQIGETLWLPPPVNSKSLLASLAASTDNVGQDLDDQVEMGSSREPTYSAPPAAPPNKTGVAVINNPSTPLRSSSLIVIAGIILILSAAVYLLWKRSQVEESLAIQQAPLEPEMTDVDNSSKLNKLTRFIKTKLNT